MTAILLISGAGCGDVGYSGAGPTGTDATTTSCSSDPSAKWIARVNTDGPVIQVYATDAGLRRGVREWAWFSRLAEDCIENMKGSTTISLAPWRDRMTCELWLHNVAAAALADTGKLGEVVRSSSSLSKLMAHGWPADLDARVWAGDATGTPLDGRPVVCKAMHRVIDPTLDDWIPVEVVSDSDLATTTVGDAG
jgi:hypothetical protein